jgi:hypothetical protein
MVKNSDGRSLSITGGQIEGGIMATCWHLARNLAMVLALSLSSEAMPKRQASISKPVLI